MSRLLSQSPARNPELSKLVFKLRGLLEEYPGLKFALLFGSSVNKTTDTLRDVDLLLEGGYNDSRLLLDLAKTLNMPIEKIDLVKLEHMPAKVLARALNEGVIILSRDEGFLTGVVEKVALEYPEIMNLYKLNSGYLLNPKNEIDKARLLDLLNNAIDRARSLDKLLKERGKEDFESNDILDAALRWYLYEIIQSLVDACAVLVSCLKLGVAESYKDYIVTLIEKNMMSRGIGEELADFISLRNRLAHRYRYVGVEELVKGAEKLLSKTLPAFQKWLLNVIKNFEEESE